MLVLIVKQAALMMLAEFRERLRFNLAGNGHSTQTGIREWVGRAAYKALGRTDDWFPAPEDR